jgi:release factor glutamine methyltransferase
MFGNLLDLCTGSGCVAIAFAKQRPTWHVVGTDVSPDAVALAHENAVRLGAAFNTAFLACDLAAGVPPQRRFDLVTANPPYIPSGDVAALDPSIRDFEPRPALDGGADGLAVLRRVTKEAVPRLKPGGVLAVEIQFDQAARVRELFERAGLTAIETQRDYGGHERVVSGVLPGAQRNTDSPSMF